MTARTVVALRACAAANVGPLLVTPGEARLLLAVIDAEAPAPARVLRDGEGGCEPLPAAPDTRLAPRDLAKLLLDALARGRS